MKFNPLRWVITRSLNNARGGYRNTEPMKRVAENLEARAVLLCNQRRVGKLVGYVTYSRIFA
jgi:DNA polymerase elongation subunit (family B)